MAEPGWCSAGQGMCRVRGSRHALTHGTLAGAQSLTLKVRAQLLLRKAGRVEHRVQHLGRVEPAHKMRCCAAAFALRAAEGTAVVCKPARWAADWQPLRQWSPAGLRLTGRTPGPSGSQKPPAGRPASGGPPAAAAGLRSMGGRQAGNANCTVHGCGFGNACR